MTDAQELEGWLWVLALIGLLPCIAITFRWALDKPARDASLCDDSAAPGNSSRDSQTNAFFK